MQSPYELLGLLVVLQFLGTGAVALLVLPLEVVASLLPLLLFFSFVLFAYLSARVS